MPLHELEFHELEKDVLKRFGDDDFMWVVVWGDLVALQNFMERHENITLQRLNEGISAANYMSYMASSDRTTHFKRIRDALKEFRTNLYPDAWSTRFANLRDNTLGVLFAPFNWIGNIFSEAVVEIATETSISELEKIDAAANANDDLKVPSISYEIEIVRPLLMSLKNYFQQRLIKLDVVIVSVQTELERSDGLQERLDLIKKWDKIVSPLEQNNAVAFCENVQQYMQKSNGNDQDQTIYPSKTSKRELLFNAPQHRVDFVDALLEQAKTISTMLESRNSNKKIRG